MLRFGSRWLRVCAVLTAALAAVLLPVWRAFPRAQALAADGSPPRWVYLSGEPIGIRLATEGVTVSGTAEVMTGGGSVCPAKLAGLREGDVIMKVDGRAVDSAARMQEYIEQSGGGELTLLVRRGGRELTLRFSPVWSSIDERFRAGIWLRDSTACIGTLTYIEPETMNCCAVGHPLGDGEEPTDAAGGTITEVTLSGVQPGARGVPGELIGYLGDRALGVVTGVRETGIYGRLDDGGEPAAQCGAPCRVARRGEVRTGAAKLLVRLPESDCPQLYEIEIVSTDSGRGGSTRNMIIKVTDRRLLERTGGIVQGMSGCPIIQDGMFAAAVTHVFVSDPTRGYAVYAESMLEGAPVNSDNSAKAAA